MVFRVLLLGRHAGWNDQVCEDDVSSKGTFIPSEKRVRSAKTIAYLLILVNITSFGIRGMYNSGGKKPHEYNARRFSKHAGL
jgi:hypothetical protein